MLVGRLLRGAWHAPGRLTYRWLRFIQSPVVDAIDRLGLTAQQELDDMERHAIGVIEVANRLVDVLTWALVAFFVLAVAVLVYDRSERRLPGTRA